MTKQKVNGHSNHWIQEGSHVPEVALTLEPETAVSQEATFVYVQLLAPAPNLSTKGLNACYKTDLVSITGIYRVLFSPMFSPFQKLKNVFLKFRG